MVKFTVQKLPSANKKDFEAALYTATANSTVEGLAKELNKRYKDIKCSEHPNATNQVVIVARKDMKHEFKKTNFCCQDFANSLKFTYK